METQKLAFLWCIIIISIPGVHLQNCENIWWKGNEGKPIDHCNVINENVTVFLTRMLEKEQCVNKITLQVLGYTGKKYSTHEGNYKNGKWVLKNPIKPTDRCKKVDIQVAIESSHGHWWENSFGSVFSPDVYYGTSSLDPKECFKIKEDLSLKTTKTQEVIITLTQGVFKLKPCLLNITIHNSTARLWQYQPCVNHETTCKDTWNNTLKIILSRCSNQTLTVSYNFVSGQKEQVLNVPEDQEACRAENGLVFTTTTIGVISGGSALTVAFLIVIILLIKRWWTRRLKKTEAEMTVENTDENPVYGTYSRGWEGEGEYGDGDVVEMSDRNSMYGYECTCVRNNGLM